MTENKLDLKFKLMCEFVNNLVSPNVSKFSSQASCIFMWTPGSVYFGLVVFYGISTLMGYLIVPH